MRLSIITVNLNNRLGLEKTVISVINQSFSDFEFIIIDGGSTDGSLDIINKYQNYFTYWISEKDKGTYHAMNKGIKVAKGDYCYFLNSGDFLIDNYVFEKLFHYPIQADIVSGNVLKIRKNGKYRTIVAHSKPSLLNLCIHSLPHQASLIKRELFNEIGYYTESYKIVSDFEFFLKAIVIYKKTYQFVNISFCYFNVEGISSKLESTILAKEESYACLKENFPDMVDDLMEYRYFYNSNIGQIVRLLKTKDKLYRIIENLCGWLISIKKTLIGK
jgi:glycosyltransferase involved in cell wall biosynthesis